MTVAGILFDPFLPWPVLAALAGLALMGVALALWRGLSGWGLRGLTLVVILIALANPSLQHELRTPLSNIVL
ncbi:MAG: hypothetical protein KGI94_08035, partial [Paracoccaceae bacterium]|nr:hypothetical protein [Paracoccaceae bacterium]